MISEAREYGGAFFVTLTSGPYTLPGGYRVYIIDAQNPGITVKTPPPATHRKSGQLEGAPTVFLYVVTNDIRLEDPYDPSISLPRTKDFLWDIGHAFSGTFYTYLPEVLLTAKTFPLIDGIIAGGSGPVATTQVYDYGTSSWAAGPAMSNSRANGCAATNGDSMYIGEGDGGATHERLRQTTLSWASVTNLTTTRTDGVSGSYRDRVLFFGGDSVVVDSYNVTSQTIVAVNSLPYVRTKGGAVDFPGIGRTILFAGLPALAPGYMFHYPTDSYETIDVSPGTDRRSFASFRSDGEAFSEGGYSDLLASYPGDNESFNPATRAWTTETTFSTARRRHAGWSRGEFGYTLGGERSSGSVSGGGVWRGLGGWSAFSAGVGTSLDAQNQTSGGIRQ